jgi:3-oxoacid CoA-transferase subunit A
MTVAEVEVLVPAGTLDPNQVHTPGIFVDRLVLTTSEKRIENVTTRPA